ncbi:MAG: hypothetical protein KatS3mg057_1090 [Herpetosiphonaceae bacterium]|nr:MAG: hypothetical protein KatS3mg057_1090 [Herpetosiphonaceae bacterium]
MAHTDHEHQLVHEHHEDHHGQKLYIIVGVILAIITFLEVAVALPEVKSFLGLSDTIVVVLLLLMMLAKGTLVVLYFMHLKFDSRFFALLFAFPLLLLAVPMVLIFMVLFSQHVGIAG